MAYVVYVAYVIGVIGVVGVIGVIGVIEVIGVIGAIWDAFGIHLGFIWGSFGGHFGDILRSFGELGAPGPFGQMMVQKCCNLQQKLHGGTFSSRRNAHKVQKY